MIKSLFMFSLGVIGGHLIVLAGYRGSLLMAMAGLFILVFAYAFARLDERTNRKYYKLGK